MQINMTATPDTATPRVDESTFDLYVELEAEGDATPEQIAVLESDEPAWRASLLRLLLDADEHLVAARALRGEERDQVVADAEHTHRQLTAALADLTGEQRPAPPPERPPKSDRQPQPDGQKTPRPRDDDEVVAGVVRLQLSWEPGRVVAWGGGPGCDPADPEEIAALLAAAEAPAAPWSAHAGVNVPGSGRAETVSAPVGEVLGWLVA